MTGSLRENRTLRCSRHDAEGGAFIRIWGRIDDTFEVSSLLKEAPRTLIWDLEGVTQITSFGVLAWKKAMAQLQGSELLFVNVPPALITQFNSVLQFAGPGRVISFFAPYRCHSCQRDLSRLIDLRKDATWVATEEPPTMPCSHCDGEAEFDDIPSLYFTHVARTQLPVLSKTAKALLRHLPSDARPLRVTKEIVGQLTILSISGSLLHVRTLRRFLDGVEGDTLIFCDQLEDVTLSTLTELAAHLRVLNQPCWLARARVAFCHSSVDWPENVGFASLLLDWTCSQCGNVEERDIDFQCIPGSAAFFCSRDGHALTQAPHDISPMTYLQEAPASVMSFLQARRLPLSPQEQVKANLLAEGKEATSSERMARFGGYLLVEKLGENHVMETYKARPDRNSETSPVILKRVIDAFRDDLAFSDTFNEEIRRALQLRHANVIPLIDKGQSEGRAFYVTELVEGLSLKTALERAKRLGHPMTLAMSFHVVKELAAALRAAHNLRGGTGEPTPLIHREVSPHCVWLTFDGQVKLTDFAVAKAADHAQWTPAYAAAGRLTYLAPEQIRSTVGISDVRIDLFPLGLILFYCATLEQMFERTTEYGTLWALLNDSFRSLSEHLPDVLPEADAFLTRCLQRDARHRYQTAEELGTDAQRIIELLGENTGPQEMADWLASL